MIHLTETGTGHVECDVCNNSVTVEGCENDDQAVEQSGYIEDNDRHYCGVECQMQDHGYPTNDTGARRHFERTYR